jgi:DNA-binding NarL/FixJ family response regulator
MKPQSSIKVALVDDHQIVVDGLASLLAQEDDIEVIATAFTGKQLLSSLKKEQPHVVLADINLPDLDGIALSRKIKNHYPEIQILALTMHKVRKFVYKMVEIGVSGFILKNADNKELVNAIRTIASGNQYYGSEVKDLFFESQENTHSESMQPKLTRREIEILGLIAKEYTTQEIADKLFLTHDTVETHRKNIIQKLNVRNTAGMVKAAMEQNLISV